MNISVMKAFEQVQAQFKIDLHSQFAKSEAKFCITKMFDLLDLSGKNAYEVKLFCEQVENFVFKKFNLI